MDLQQGSCGGRDWLCLKLQAFIHGPFCSESDPRGSATPLSPGDHHPKETQLLVAISKHTPSRAALYKKDRPQDNRSAPLPPLNATFCTSLGAKIWYHPCLGWLEPGQADLAEAVQTYFSTGPFFPACPQSWDKPRSSWQAPRSSAQTLLCFPATKADWEAVVPAFPGERHLQEPWLGPNGDISHCTEL